jgi:hypothetical protein
MSSSSLYYVIAFLTEINNSSWIEVHYIHKHSNTSQAHYKAEFYTRMPITASITISEKEEILSIKPNKLLIKREESKIDSF